MKDTAIFVRVLGGFSLSCGEIVLPDESNRAYKVWLPLAYLLVNRDRDIAREEWLRLLGEGEYRENLGGILNGNMLRCRRMLEPLREYFGTELILNHRGFYRWNPEVPVQLDLEEFEREVLLGGQEGTEEQRLANFQSAIALYRGPFLPMLSSNYWVDMVSVGLQERFLYAINESAVLLNRMNCAEEAERLCRLGIRADTINEALSAELMRCLMAQGKYEEAEAVFRDLSSRLFSELGVAPDQQIRELHGELMSFVGQNRLSTDFLQDHLREQQPADGAMICDFSTFRLFYQAEARSADRRGDAVHIGILSVESKKGKRLSEKVTENAMEQLREVIRETLRIGDVAARCSTTQYVVLLVQASYESCMAICGRIAAAFARAHGRSLAKITSQVMPLEPVAEGSERGAAKSGRGNSV